MLPLITRTLTRVVTGWSAVNEQIAWAGIAAESGEDGERAGSGGGGNCHREDDRRDGGRDACGAPGHR